MTRLQKIGVWVAAIGTALAGTVYAVTMLEDTPRSGRVCLPLEQVPDSERGPEAHWFVAVADTWTPDPGFGLVTAEGGGSCYDYSLTATVIGGWRLMAARGAPYFKARWQAAAASAGPTQLKMWRSYAGIKADCLTVLSAAQCLALMREVNDCWEVGDGDACIEGRLYGAGKGGFDACTPLASWAPFACTLAFGQTEAGIE